MVCPRSSDRVLVIRPEFESARLTFRRLDTGDAPFLIRLLNEPSFIENIGDRGVRSVEDAHRYLREGPFAMYERYGFGLWRVARRTDDEPIGMCGLLKREMLADFDLGYAYLPEHWGQGHAFEAAQATLRDAAARFGLRRAIGVVSPGNIASIRLLEKLGMRFEGVFPLQPQEPEVRVYGCSLTPDGVTGA
jgi:RimJ/RimL family protein N-acetyltransferase